jgi:selenocysteine lyase/cysteine desulfurase
MSYKLAPGGAPYELQVGCAAVLPYLLGLGKAGKDDQEKLNIAFARISAHEGTLSKRLMQYLTSKDAYNKGVRVVGPDDIEHRAPTISFVVVEEVEEGLWRKRITSKDIVQVFDQRTNVRESLDGCSLMIQIGLKYGHFYATRIMPCLPLVQEEKVTEQLLTRGSAWKPKPDEDGFVRISLVHYNTVDEVDEIVKVLQDIL